MFELGDFIGALVAGWGCLVYAYDAAAGVSSVLLGIRCSSSTKSYDNQNHALDHSLLSTLCAT
uniref:hypothetical protein n=1 Tax=Salmonella enterica TaxID=28901 RepID=UPI00398C3AED